MKPKTFLCMPMRWEPHNALKNFWNADDDRILPPKYFGIGWDINLHALLQRVGVIASKSKE